MPKASDSSSYAYKKPIYIHRNAFAMTRRGCQCYTNGGWGQSALCHRKEPEGEDWNDTPCLPWDTPNRQIACTEFSSLSPPG